VPLGLRQCSTAGAPVAALLTGPRHPLQLLLLPPCGLPPSLSHKQCSWPPSYSCTTTPYHRMTPYTCGPVIPELTHCHAAAAPAVAVPSPRSLPLARTGLPRALGAPPVPVLLRKGAWRCMPCQHLVPSSFQKVRSGARPLPTPNPVLLRKGAWQVHALPTLGPLPTACSWFLRLFLVPLPIPGSLVSSLTPKALPLLACSAQHARLTPRALPLLACSAQHASLTPKALPLLACSAQHMHAHALV